MSNTMSIFAEALIDAQNYKKGKARINGEAVGVAKAREWSTAVKALRVPAYAIRVYRHDHMGDTETVTPCDMTEFFNALRVVIDMVGVVNGAKLDIQNMAEEILAKAMKDENIAISNEMAHAYSERSIARKALREEETEEHQAEVDKWVEECKRLESLPGNCKTKPTIVSEGGFVLDVEHLFTEAITKQAAKSVEQVLAEIKAKEDTKKARQKANRAAKRQAEAVARKNAEKKPA